MKNITGYTKVYIPLPPSVTHMCFLTYLVTGSQKLYNKTCYYYTMCQFFLYIVVVARIYLQDSPDRVITCVISCISQEQILIFWILDKFLPVSNMASSRSEENVNLNYYTNWWCHSYGETCNFFEHICKIKLADVIANDYWQ